MTEVLVMASSYCHGQAWLITWHFSHQATGPTAVQYSTLILTPWVKSPTWSPAFFPLGLSVVPSNVTAPSLSQWHASGWCHISAKVVSPIVCCGRNNQALLGMVTKQWQSRSAHRHLIWPDITYMWYWVSRRRPPSSFDFYPQMHLDLMLMTC